MTVQQLIDLLRAQDPNAKATRGDETWGPTDVTSVTVEDVDEGDGTTARVVVVS